MTEPSAPRPRRAAIRDTALPADAPAVAEPDAPAVAEPDAPAAVVGTATLLRTESLTRHFKIGRAISRHRSTLHAVDDFSLDIG
jgi:hypothetical protein